MFVGRTFTPWKKVEKKKKKKERKKKGKEKHLPKRSRFRSFLVKGTVVSRTERHHLCRYRLTSREESNLDEEFIS